MNNPEETLFWIIQTCYPERPIIYRTLQEALNQAQLRYIMKVYEYRINENGFPMNHGSYTLNWDGSKGKSIWEYYRFD